MDAELLDRIDGLKRERGLLKDGAPLPSYTLEIAESRLAPLKEQAAHFVTALSKLAYACFVGTPPLPSLEELGYDLDRVRFMRANPPRHHREMMVHGRLDVTSDGARHTTYEFNGSQPGGMEFAGVFAHPVFAALLGSSRVQQITSQYLETALALYRQRRQREEPRGVLVLSHGYHLFETLGQAYEEQLGCVVFKQPDGARCAFDGRRLLLTDADGTTQPIDLILRSPRTNLKELMSPVNRAIREAWACGRAELANPPCSAVMGNKLLYVYLSVPACQQAAGISAAERAAIGALLPRVILLDEKSRPDVLAHKDDWVIKHAIGGRGRLVWLGAETAADQWRQLIESTVGQRGWLGQGFQAPHRLRIRLHDVDDTRLTVPATIDPYVTLGAQAAVSGFLCRAVIPQTDDPAELENVKLNLLGENLWIGADGERRRRIIGFGGFDARQE